ncbi:MAG: cation:proton antiporter [Bacteroidales bacterium]|nr:cation:proton antiporter [Bacteroidales bacterium]
MDFSSDFLPLFIVVGLAWFSPIITSQIRIVQIPSVVFEIGLGIIIGPFVLNILPESEYLNFLGLMGFVFLMFLSGLEINVTKVIHSFPRRKITWDRLLKNPLLTGVIIYILTLLLAILSALLLRTIIPIKQIWYFALIISTSSLGVIMPVIKNRSEIQQPYGQMLIMAAAVADILSILLFTFTISIIEKGVRFEVFLIISLFVLFFVFYQLGRILVKVNLFKRILNTLSHAASQIKVRGVLALILLFVMVSQLIKTEVILGAFLAGILISYFSDKDRSTLMMKLDGMGHGFFIPIFFILVGAKIDLAVFQEAGQLLIFLISLLVLLFLIKALPSMIWIRLFGWRKALSGGILLSSRLSLIIAAAAVGLNLGVITPAMNTSFILLAVLTCILAPLLFNQITGKGKGEEEKIFIIGGGGRGVFLAKNLKMHNKQSIIIDLKKEKADSLNLKGIKAIHGNATDIGIYKKYHLNPGDYIVILTHSEQRNYHIAQILREKLKHGNIISCANKKEVVNQLDQIGVESLDGAQVIATAIENIIFRPATYHTLFESFESFNVEIIQVQNKAVSNHQIKEIPFHQDGSIMMINRDGEYFIPHGDDYFHYGDKVVVFGRFSAIKDFKLKLVGESQKQL